jgi:hypothetical protein
MNQTIKTNQTNKTSIDIYHEPDTGMAGKNRKKGIRQHDPHRAGKNASGQEQAIQSPEY